MGEKPKTQDLSEILSTCKTSDQLLKEISLYYPRISNAVPELAKFLKDNRYSSEFVDIKGPDQLREQMGYHNWSKDMLFLLLPSTNAKDIPCLGHRYPGYPIYYDQYITYGDLPFPFTRYYTDFEVFGDFDLEQDLTKSWNFYMHVSTAIPVTVQINESVLHGNFKTDHNFHNYRFALPTHRNERKWRNGWKVIGLKMPLVEIDTQTFSIRS